LDSAGIQHTRLHRGKHEAVEFLIEDERQTFIIPGSPSDWRAPRNARSQLRRMLRQRR
jgi:predicted Ser/Thr protein kinase